MKLGLIALTLLLFQIFSVNFADKKNPAHSFGGIHGLAILVSNKFNGKFQVLRDTSSDCILWIKLEMSEFAVLIGSVYVPYEGSNYFDEDWNDKIIDDCIKLKAKHNLPFLLIGDFNARSGVLDDFITFDEGIQAGIELDFWNEDFNVKDDLENFGVCTKSYNNDVFVNNNGHKLISLCKNLDVHIVNGRVGADREKGLVTCANASTIDYVLASTELFLCMDNFCVDVVFKQYISIRR